MQEQAPPAFMHAINNQHHPDTGGEPRRQWCSLETIVQKPIHLALANFRLKAPCSVEDALLFIVCLADIFTACLNEFLWTVRTLNKRLLKISPN